MRLSVEVTPDQHQRLKAIAALQGKSIKDYVLDRVLPATPPGDDDKALQALEAFLEPRIKEATQGRGAAVSVTQLFKEAHQDIR